MNRIHQFLVTCSLLALSVGGQAQQDASYFVKHLQFSGSESVDQKAAMAARLVPSPQQLAWQQMELTAFLHFGINTFTGREWGDGTEDPALFNPTDLDADQWVRTLKECGFKMVLLTAKHHDGFCLWPTKTTSHSVASSPWKNGKGDVVRELRDACTKYGMKFGVYLSPWDRNASCYGNSPEYNKFFIEQLTELLTNYGEVNEVWFDGANGEGPNGKKQIYDWDAFYKTIQRLQPKAVMAIMGDDVRWVGNEKGIGRETEWSATVLTPGIYSRAEENNKRLGVYGKAKDLGSRSMLKDATELFWYPSEVDVSIRPGWFWHEEENTKVKSLKQLSDIYFQSVGYNSVLLLNIPPDRRGLINEADVERLKEFADYRRKVFSDNKVSDGNIYWTALPGESRSYTVRPGELVNVVQLQEDISKGQRVEKFLVEAFSEGRWQTLGEGTTIGYKRMFRFPEVMADSLRLRIDGSRLSANIMSVSAYYAPSLENDQKFTDWNTVSRDTWKKVSSSPFVVDLGRTIRLKAFTYAPLNEEAKPTMAYRYKFSVSLNGTDWKEIISQGEFSNIMHNPLPQTVTLPAVVTARYVKLEATTPEVSSAIVEMEEFGVTSVADKDDETKVYPNPDEALKLKPGDSHPMLKGWSFYTAHEFLDKNTKKGLPLGFLEHKTTNMSKSANVNNAKCSKVENGVLHMWSVEEPDSIDNGFGKKVKFSHAGYRSVVSGKQAWCNFTENMRIEIRFKRVAAEGFNDALWFMGNKGPWPKNGEIDLLENPKKKINQRAHFTLHSENHYAGVVGGEGSVTSTIDLADMSQWNIYWLEWYPDRIIGGVNGKAYFEHKKGDNGNTDWPWSDPAGFYVIFSTGLSVNPNAWPGAVNPAAWDKQNPPSMYIDWIRVYVNDNYAGKKAPKVRYY